jgi:hypothetical protein
MTNGRFFSLGRGTEVVKTAWSGRTAPVAPSSHHLPPLCLSPPPPRRSAAVSLPWQCLRGATEKAPTTASSRSSTTGTTLAPVHRYVWLGFAKIWEIFRFSSDSSLWRFHFCFVCRALDAREHFISWVHWVWGLWSEMQAWHAYV